MFNLDGLKGLFVGIVLGFVLTIVLQSRSFKTFITNQEFQRGLTNTFENLRKE